MKALTVRQPHAQLIALGVKTIETRTKPTKYRGPLLIHAGAHKPLNHEHRHVDHDEVPMWIDQVDISRFWKWYEHPDNMYHGGLYCWDGPLGAIVASCKLVDCVPILGPLDDDDPIPHALIADGPSLALFYAGDYFAIECADQLPYGDFTPGRFAWLLEDIKPVEQRCPACWGEKEVWMGPETCPDCRERPRYGCCLCNGSGLVKWREGCRTCQAHGTCDPIPAKGKQGLWEWTP